MIGDRCCRFLKIVFATSAILFQMGLVASAMAQSPPYPSSRAITGFNLDWTSTRAHAEGSDNWPSSWASDGVVYTSFQDGGGFGANAEALYYVGIGIAELRGDSASSVVGRNLISGLNWSIAPCFPLLPREWIDNRKPQPGHKNPCKGKSINAKSVSMLALNDSLYMWLTPSSGPWGLAEHRLYQGRVATNTWKRADWSLTPNVTNPLLSPVFLQAGKNYEEIRDYVYAYAGRHAPVPDATVISPVWLHKGPGGGQIALLRAPKDSDLLVRSNWELFTGLNGSGDPTWTKTWSAWKPVFTDPNGVGRANNAIYVPQLGRYLLFTHHTAHFGGHFGLFEARNLWGPWSTIFYGVIANTSKGVPARGKSISFLPNSFSADGKRFTVMLTGGGRLDNLTLINGSFDTVNRAAD